MVRARAVVVVVITTDMDQAERSVLPGNRLGSEKRDSLAGVPLEAATEDTPPPIDCACMLLCGSL